MFLPKKDVDEKKLENYFYIATIKFNFTLTAKKKNYWRVTGKFFRKKLLSEFFLGNFVFLIKCF